MWAEEGWAAARGIDNMAQVEKRASCSAGTGMCAWSRSVAIALVTASQRDTAPKQKDLPMDEQQQKEGAFSLLASWLTPLRLGTLPGLLGGC